MDRLERNFVQELTEASKRIDKNLNIPKPRYDVEPPIQRSAEVEVTVPEAMQAPIGELFAIWRRSNKGYNKRIFYNLPENEARAWTLRLNQKEQEKRSNYGVIPEEVFLFDFAAHNSPAEDAYWNPAELIKSEFDKPAIVGFYEDIH